MKTVAKSKSILIAFLGALNLLIFASAAATELPSLPSNRVPPSQSRAAQSDAFVLPPISSDVVGTSVSPKGERYRINQITFRGNTVISNAELDALSQPYLDRFIGPLEIEELRQSITKLYIKNGFVTSGAVLKSSLSANATQLEFTLIEGRIGQIQIQGTERLNERYVAERLVPEPNSVLNIEQLRERYELLLLDPLFNSISTRLVPGQDQGSSLLYVDVTRATPYQFSVFTNNYTAPSIGELTTGMSGLLRNLTGYGDTLTLNGQGRSQNFKMSRVGLNWLMPLNNQGTQLSLQADDGATSLIQSSVSSLDIQSNLKSSEFGIHQTLFNSPKTRLTIGLAKSKRKNETTLLGEPFSFAAGIPEGVLTQNAYKLWQDYSWRSESTVFAVRMTRNQIQNNLIPDVSGASTSQPPNNYAYWLTQFTLGHRLKDSGILLQMQGSIQNASSHLTSLDRFGMGGAMTVRGYRENHFLLDRGSVINLETEIPVIHSSGANEVSFKIAPFFNVGTGRNLGESKVSLSSMGVTLKSEWKGFVASLALAKRLISPSSANILSGTLQDKGIHFQLMYSTQQY
jgi:hemolysin activation/secretion protein